jgi:outer membrane lipoprotein-sorting protein
MRIRSLRLLGVLALVLLGQTASAQTADEIIERSLKALGGREALSKLTTRVATGTITVSTPGGDVSGPIEIANQAPNKVRVLIKLDLAAFNLGQISVDQRFDGNTGFVIDTLQGNRDITGDQLELMRNTPFPSALLTYREAGTGVELAGTEKLGDREAYVLVLKPKTGPPVRQYIDTMTNLMVRQVVKAAIDPVGEIEQTTEILAYRDVNGIQEPVRIRTVSPIQTATINITSLQHNVPVDSSSFAKP